MAILLDWVRQTTATTGTGTITLGDAVFGFIRFQDDTRLTDGAQVYYTIEDGSNRERGIGTYTAAGSTLSRDVIHATLVGGTYTENPGTGLTLSGSAVVSCSAIANTHNFRGCLLTKSTTQSLPSGVGVNINWDQEVYDTDGFHDNVANNSRITIPEGVSVVVVKGSLYVSPATSNLHCRPLLNGNSFSGAGEIRLPPNGSLLTQCISSPIFVNVGDYLELQAYCGGSATAIATSPYVTNFSVQVLE